MDVYAYELLHRRGKENQATFTDGDLATSQVIINIFLDVGLENLVGSKPAFINITGDFFTGDYPLPVSHEQVVFELLETIAPDTNVIAGVRCLVAQGYRIALDDYLLRDDTLPLLELAAFVKLDVLAMTADELARTVERLRHYPLQLVAEKVETPAPYEMCRALGFYLFQPGKFIRGHDDRAEIWIHKAFSAGAQYQAVLPTEENALWIQRSSEGAPSNGLSGFKATSSPTPTSSTPKPPAPTAAWCSA